MLRLALSTLAARKSGTFGALTAVGLAVILIVSCGILLQSSLQRPIAVERLHGTSVVVEGPTTVTGSQGQGNINEVSLTERGRLPSSPVGRIRRIPGVETVIADRSVYAAAIDGHGRLVKSRNGPLPAGHCRVLPRLWGRVCPRIVAASIRERPQPKLLLADRP